jgi:hypothetical protein
VATMVEKDEKGLRLPHYTSSGWLKVNHPSLNKHVFIIEQFPIFS